MKTLFTITSAALCAHLSLAGASDWKPAENTMLTPWGEKLDPANVWPEYPRPQMERADWKNLNGFWNYAVTDKAASKPSAWDGDILVPFALEAPLSGVGRKLQPSEALWYKRTFNHAPKEGTRLLLHFEAVDYKTEVWVNGQRVGSNIGGNLPFSFDIGNAARAGSNEVLVKVLDATDTPGTYQLRGKQVFKNGGIWYTPVSGIWQTVWLETVPENHIQSVRIDTRVTGDIAIQPTIVGKGSIKTTAYLDGKEVSSGTEKLKVDAPKLWSPKSPALYDLKVELVDANGNVLDTVNSYFGIRECGKRQDADGNWRFTLNGEEIFHYGPLDQGWWPDGLLTPPSEEAMLFDMHYLQEAGFNMIRKHIKVEPRRYYYHCDRMGFLVWQDQVSGGTRVGAPKNAPPIKKKEAQAKSEWPEWKRLHQPDSPITELDKAWPDWAHEQWMAELKGMVDHLHNYPSIVVWTPFNERWGQHRTMAVGEWIAQYDPSRSINIASGGNFFPVGDIADHHQYPHPMFPMDDPAFNGYLKVVGEYGGHGWPVDGHIWKIQNRNWGYGGLPKTLDEYKARFSESARILGELKKQGVSAGVYTQTTDVEVEINGLMTYDRKVLKIPAAELKKLHKANGLAE
ncbi:Beta-galactosidase [Pontiella desulfatans]|uniref:Beta-galactosidase n=1 Tax=Pontiella desulfatans TaxID=2750659 RepID=A0A6C2U075_PONDE|nr:sugar-binding domain-containing protein [Pontiella desulfatans]VGO13322.1 Beta-galactosidase [Pontiella desulfatans]